MGTSLNTKVGLLPVTAVSSLLLKKLTQKSSLNYYLDRTINLQKTTINDAPSGQQRKASTTQSDLPQDGGSGLLRDDELSPCYCEAPPNWGSITSYPDDNPKTALGSKKVPLELVPPSVEHALAEAFSLGAKKYGPYNWREKRVSSNVYYAAALRHLKAWWDGEDLDPESSFSHLSHVLACVGILVDARSIGKLNDNRPPKGAASDLQKQWLARNE